MDQQQPQQPPPPQIHRGVLNGIARLTALPYYHKRRLSLLVCGYREPVFDRPSLEYLVNFLDHRDDDSLEVTGIMLQYVHCLKSDGGLNVLSDFFARSDTRLTNATLWECDFGSREDVAQLLSPFYTNKTITGLTIHQITNLEGVALGTCLSNLMQNMPQLQCLICSQGDLRLDGTRALQPGLRSNRTLKQLVISSCKLGDGGFRIVADALVGNTTMHRLSIRGNDITRAGLDDVIRLIKSTELKTIDFIIQDNAVFNHQDVFADEAATQRFVTTLQQQKSCVEEIPNLCWSHFCEKNNYNDDRLSYAKSCGNSIGITMTRNRQLNHVNSLLLAPITTIPQQQQQRNAGTLMLKTYHTAIAKFGRVRNNAGASAIFNLLTSRPQLLEKRIKRPSPTNARRREEDSSSLRNANGTK
jgi:Leucine Rich repeat